MRLRSLVSLAIPALLCAAVAAADAADAAEPESGSWFEAAADGSWLATYDPTLIGRRIYTEFSYEDESGGIATAKVSTSARFAASPWKNVALGAQVELPVKWSDTGSGSVSGLDDFEFRTGFVVRAAPGLRWGSGVNLKFPTATDPALGEEHVEVRPIVAVSWDALPWLNLGINAAYSVTPADSGSGGVNKLELKFPIACRFGANWSGALTYKPTWDFASGDTTQKLEVGAARLLGERKRFALSPSIEVPLTSQSLEWKLILGLAWYF